MASWLVPSRSGEASGGSTAAMTRDTPSALSTPHDARCDFRTTRQRPTVGSDEYAALIRFEFVGRDHAANRSCNFAAADLRWFDWRRLRIVVAVRANQSQVDDLDVRLKCLS